MSDSSVCAHEDPSPPPYQNVVQCWRKLLVQEKVRPPPETASEDALTGIRTAVKLLLESEEKGSSLPGSLAGTGPALKVPPVPATDQEPSCACVPAYFVPIGDIAVVSAGAITPSKSTRPEISSAAVAPVGIGDDV